jgi:soluble lytic murein transglycosylase-like protein
MRTLSLLVFVCLATAHPASAQIYTWRDDSGRPVSSNRLPADVEEASSRAETRARYDDLIEQHAASHGLSSDLVRAVIQAESGFNAHAVSSKGAMGLMQLMPATARALGLSDPFRPDDNIRGGVAYLAQLLARYHHDLQLGLAAYNAGPGSVERYGGVPPYRETRDYVEKIMGAIAATKAPTPSGSVIYRSVETVNGTTRRRYSNIPPREGQYEVVGRR